MTRLIIAAAALALAACASNAPAARNGGYAAFGPLEARIEAGEFGNVHALLAQRGPEVFEEAYFTGPDERRGWPLGTVVFDADTLHDARSISKTVVALLYGAALAEGKVPALDQPALDAFPEHADLRTPERLRVTIGHLLTMTSGFAWDEFTYPYQDARNSERLMDAAPDRYRYVFEQAFAHEPGTTWTYSGGDVAVIARILERGTGMALEDYAAQALFAPLGIEAHEWLKDRQGVAFAASGLRLRPRDFVKIGRLIADRGAWEGRAVAPPAWVDAMIAPHARVGGEPPCGMAYGYFTWLSALCAEGAPPAPYAAGIGYGGQRLIVFPETRLVIMITAGNYADREQDAKARALITAVRAAAGP
jgi:CubicO group peptidase (beta-lactamase class C family)